MIWIKVGRSFFKYKLTFLRQYLMWHLASPLYIYFEVLFNSSNDKYYFSLFQTVHQTMQQKAHLHSSSYEWCTIFLISVLYKIPIFCVVQNSFFSVMYNIPDFSDVQYSCFLWCTIFLFSMMYNILIFCDVQYSCFPCSTLVWCMIIWCSLFLKMAWCT